MTSPYFGEGIHKIFSVCIY